MEIYDETYIKSHFSKVALTQASRCSQRARGKTPLLPENKQSFLRLQLNVLHYHTVHFLFNLLSLSTFLSQQTLLDDLWKNLQINSWFNFITNVFVCVQRLFMDQHCVQVVNLKKGGKMILFLCAQDHIFSFFSPWYWKMHGVWCFYTSTVSKFKILTLLYAHSTTQTKV